MSWIKTPAWLKVGLISSGIITLIFILFLIFGLDLVSDIANATSDRDSSIWLGVSAIFYFIIYLTIIIPTFILGSIIGLIIQKLKKKTQ